MTAPLKKCTKCPAELPDTREFFYSHGPRGNRKECKGCTKKATRARTHERLKDPAFKEYWANQSARNHRRREYGLTDEQFRAMVEAQGGLCAICGKAPDGGRRTRVLHVDHDHSTGKVRELLCRHCNHGLGNFRDSPESCEAAAAYLRRHAQPMVAVA